MIAAEPVLDLRPGRECLFFVLAFVTDNSSAPRPGP
ncbi:hypothetical protein ABH935_009269 [Catenulispora sp. GAS73]